MYVYAYLHRMLLCNCKTRTLRLVTNLKIDRSINRKSGRKFGETTFHMYYVYRRIGVAFNVISYILLYLRNNLLRHIK